MQTIYFEKIGSTNDYLKKLKNPSEDILVIAKRQTGGRGTKGRTFLCEEGGVYLSLLKLFPCKAKDSFSIMMTSAVAVLKTLHAFGVNAKIKWPNDIFVNGKKICGILIENVFEGDFVSRSIIGIGLNVNNQLGDEIKDIAINVKSILGKELSVDTVSATLCFNLYQPLDINYYKNNLLFIGEEVTIVTEKSTYKAIISHVSDNGELVLKDGTTLSSAEVSIR